ncbi:MAG: sigma-70 family RNA polymerase sigma factor [Planctomycetota bacterium]|nr:sigma-70 family RNA polymerase sigma factor [Planctomycetota bacterium]
MTERSDVELMAAVKAGDDEAFRELVNRHRAAIVNLAYRYCRNRTDAEDLAQVVFLKVYRARDRYEPAAKFTTWLYRIAVNASLNEVRNRKNRPTHHAASLGPRADDTPGFAQSVADDGAAAPIAEVERQELHEQVRAAVEDLPERQRMALLLNKFHGLSYEELAATMEMTIPGIKSLLLRARENVRVRLEPYLKAGADRWSEKRGTA